MKGRAKNPAAVALGRLGAQAGASKAGKARMAKLTPEQRTELGRKAIRARWTQKRKVSTPPSEVVLLARDAELVSAEGKLAADRHTLHAPTPGHERYLVVVADLWSRQLAQSRSVAMLLEVGLYDSARVLARAAYETAIDLAYLITIGNKLENAFLYFARQLLDLARVFPEDAAATKAIASLPDEVATRVKQDQKKDKLWSGLYLSDMAQKIGVEGHERVYARLCMVVHVREAGLHIKRERQTDGSTRLIYGSPGESKDVEGLASLMRRFLRRNYKLVMLDFYGYFRQQTLKD